MDRSAGVVNVGEMELPWRKLERIPIRLGGRRHKLGWGWGLVGGGGSSVSDVRSIVLECESNTYGALSKRVAGGMSDKRTEADAGKKKKKGVMKDKPFVPTAEH